VHVLITGASAGIGAALARELARRGAKLTLVARRRSLLDELATEVGGAPCVIDVDLSDPQVVPQVIEKAEAAHGAIDVLINNAAVQRIDAAAETDIEAAEKQLLLNLHTPLRLTHTLLPKMVERRSGTIVDVSSAAAFAGQLGMAYYTASKAGLAFASELLRGELRGTGVHVLTVYPGWINTDLGDNGAARYDIKGIQKIYRPGDAPKLAKKVADAIEKKKDRVVYPALNRAPMIFPWTSRWVMDRLGPELK
jgi:short-subunit dehydrogenase